MLPLSTKEIDMKTFIKRLPQSTLVSLSGLIIAALLAASFALLVFPRVTPRAALAAATPTCATAPTVEHCEKQDPEVQGCGGANAKTLAQADIVENGVTIGRAERRWALRCTSWWGRVFDYRQGSQANMFIAIAGVTQSASPTFVGKPYRILYSRMVFNASPNQTVPEIVGSLAIDGIAPPVTATIPAIVIPAQ
jgi:hypothetical protein